MVQSAPGHDILEEQTTAKRLKTEIMSLKDQITKKDKELELKDKEISFFTNHISSLKDHLDCQSKTAIVHFLTRRLFPYWGSPFSPLPSYPKVLISSLSGGNASRSVHVILVAYPARGTKSRPP